MIKLTGNFAPPKMLTPIEFVSELMISADDRGSQVAVCTVLVPEQCMEFALDGKLYHMTIEEIE